ncbi:uncharacterized protein LOC144166060 [Haemaphysalis longicornis]
MHLCKTWKRITAFTGLQQKQCSSCISEITAAPTSEEPEDALKASQNLPPFSECARPILEGKNVPENLRKKLHPQLRAEIALFLDESDVITSSNTAECRCMHKALGDVLLQKYPHFTWDEPRPGSCLQQTQSQIYVLSSSSMSGITYDMNRVRTLLEITMEDRRRSHTDPLPQYFLVEEILEWLCPPTRVMRQLTTKFGAFFWASKT